MFQTKFRISFFSIFITNYDLLIPTKTKLSNQITYSTIKARDTPGDTPDISNLQTKKKKKCADLVHAFLLGFDVSDAAALLRSDDYTVESFNVKMR